MPNLINDSTTNTLSSALDGLSTRQQVIGHNIANAETPGYQALTVSFEGQLEKALKPAHGAQLTITQQGHLPSGDLKANGPRVVQRTGGANRLDGNNVDIDAEMTQLAETSIRYQSITQLISRKLALLKAIASGR